MALAGKRTFVGLGFGAIQAGLFLYEAFRCGGFGRLVVGEVVPDVVNAIRGTDGWYSLNVAHADRVEVCMVGPVEIESTTSVSDVQRLVQSIAEAEEISTAVPSVRNYTTPGIGSIHRILAEGLRRKAACSGPRAVVYAAENHNEAAEILQAAVMDEVPEAERAAVSGRVLFLNTVIGKMSGVISDPDEVQALGLATVTPLAKRAFLVEAFNRILVSQVGFDEAAKEPRFQRALTVFEEKKDLYPFEEAKLYGHNATHALAAYVGALRGLRCIADLPRFPDILNFVRDAFLQESGAALIRKHAGKDPLFTCEGYREYAEDLLQRMTNPHLQDTVERVGRDPERKLGWDDRLVGTMRVAIQQNVVPRRYATGVAAALAALQPSFLESSLPARALLDPIWGNAVADTEEGTNVLNLIEDGRVRLKRWRQSAFQDAEIELA